MKSIRIQLFALLGLVAATCSEPPARVERDEPPARTSGQERSGAVAAQSAAAATVGDGDVRPANADAQAAGRRVYEEQRCAACHSIAGKGNRRNPLDGVATRLTPEQIRVWVVAPQEMKPGVQKKAYELPDAELDALLSYLSGLR